MRRLALPLFVLAVVSGVTASAALPAHTAAQSARFALDIRITGSGGTIAIKGAGAIDGSQRLSSFTFTANGKQFAAVIGSSPLLTVFLKGETVQHLPNGGTWAREDGATAGPLLDPGVAIRLGSKLGPALGTAQIAGVSTTKHAVRVALPDAQLLSPMQSTQSLENGLPVVVWVDASGNVRRLQTSVTRGSSRFDIDERLSDFGTAVHVTRPAAQTVWDQRLDDAMRLVRAAIPSVESYAADNDSVGKHDPNPRLSGYAGMTVTYLRHNYDSALGDVKIVRATAHTYCVQATVNGITAKRNGPKAAVAAGRC
jgi:hypothetical protein